MMNSRKNSLLLGLFLLFLLGRAAGPPPETSGPFLFTDRSWAISGDTLRFVVSDASNAGGRGNVVHVHLETLSGEPVNRVMVVTKEGKGEGYIPVPDSLGSGSYWLRAYSSAMQKSPGVTTIGRLLTVYHRFDEQIQSVSVPGELNHLREWDGAGVELTVSTGEVSPREEITAEVTLSEAARRRIREMVISVGLEEPGNDRNGRFYPADAFIPFSGEEVPAIEQDGFFVRGRVIPAAGKPLPDRVMVLISIPGTFPYFDYCFTDANGRFRFRLDNAFGTAPVYIRALTREAQELRVDLNESEVRTSGGGSTVLKTLDGSGLKFAKEMLEAEGWKRIFQTENQITGSPFIMNQRPEMAFYGLPDRRVVPSEFINLPDFSEISRELLPAVKFRRTGDQYSTRMLDDLEHKYFENSPLRLINGVPVINDNLLYRLKSSDIKSIDLIYQERIFGDISFKGVIAIELNEKDNLLFTEEKNLFRFNIPCLQIPISGGAAFYPDLPAEDHIPAFGRVFLFQRTGTEGVQKFRFRVSDLKGTLLVKTEGVTTDNEPFSITRKVVVR